MKKIIFILLLLPVIAYSQSKKDYVDVMDKFVRYYNANQTDSVCTLFPHQDKNCFWHHCEPARVKGEYGKIISYSYLGIDKTDPEKVTVFKVVFEKKSTKAMSFTLSKNNKFGTFRFDTENDEIKKMLARAKY